ncbi:hypothetical protein [Pleomorphomonas oryzae]|uniref:hypothetical protein n=1 Tax=Pleomorphomonas oryzae TaxID=261934 RepID=UPI00041317BA|nr:hypothetical protein [Pleomorphomonas oryzae]
MMNSKLLAAAALAVALVPSVANAQRGTRDVAPQPTAERNPCVTDHVSTFLTNLIIPQDNGQPSVAYADNPDLIGNRYGATDPAWHK